MNLKENSGIQGFTLLEVTIALGLSTLVALMLYQVFNFTARSVDRISITAVKERALAVVYAQLRRDIAGVMVPKQFIMQLQQDAADKNRSGTQSKSVQVSQENGVDQKKEKVIPKFEKIFYATNEKNSLSVLTFITRNPAAYYVDKDQKDIIPRLVRVTYKLKQDPENPDQYKLLRAQTDAISAEGFDNEQKNKFYELISGITSFKVVFYAQEKQQEDTSKTDSRSAAPETKNKEDVKKPVVFKELTSFSSDTLTLQDALIPAFISFECRFAGKNETESEKMFFGPDVADMQVILQEYAKPLPPPPPAPLAPDSSGQTKNSSQNKSGANQKVVTQGLSPSASLSSSSHSESHKKKQADQNRGVQKTITVATVRL